MILVKNNNIVIVDDEFTSKELLDAKQKLQNSSNNIEVTISKSLALKDSKIIEKIRKTLPNSRVLIELKETEYDANFNQSQIFDKEQLSTLMLEYSIASNYNCVLSLKGNDWVDDKLHRRNIIPVSKVIIASGKIEKWVDQINSAKVNGKPLSPFEKYLYAYQIVTQFKFTEKDLFEARDIARVLTGDSIVCAGFSQILSELCRRVGIPCKRQYIHIEEETNDDKNKINHMECVVELVDEKYGIKGFYIADPTIDSYDSNIKDSNSINHALMNIDEYEDLYMNESIIIKDDEPLASSYYFLRDTKSIPDNKLIEESERPLRIVQEKIKNPKFIEEFNKFNNKIYNSREDVDGNDFVVFHGEKYDRIAIGPKSYTIDEIANNDKLLSALLLRLYTLYEFSEYNEMAITAEKFAKKSLNKKFMKKTKDNESELKALSNIQKNDLILTDPILLAEIGRCFDLKTITESKSHELMQALNSAHFELPKIRDYVSALTNVYMANGYSREESEIYTKILISNSIDFAYAQGWDLLTTNNPFAVQARLRYGDEDNELKASESNEKTNE